MDEWVSFLHQQTIAVRRKQIDHTTFLRQFSEALTFITHQIKEGNTVGNLVLDASGVVYDQPTGDSLFHAAASFQLPLDIGYAIASLFYEESHESFFWMNTFDIFPLYQACRYFSTGIIIFYLEHQSDFHQPFLHRPVDGYDTCYFALQRMGRYQVNIAHSNFVEDNAKERFFFFYFQCRPLLFKENDLLFKENDLLFKENDENEFIPYSVSAITALERWHTALQSEDLIPEGRLKLEHWISEMMATSKLFLKQYKYEFSPANHTPNPDLRASITFDLTAINHNYPEFLNSTYGIQFSHVLPSMFPWMYYSAPILRFIRQLSMNLLQPEISGDIRDIPNLQSYLTHSSLEEAIEFYLYYDENDELFTSILTELGEWWLSLALSEDIDLDKYLLWFCNNPTPFISSSNTSNQNQSILTIFYHIIHPSWNSRYDQLHPATKQIIYDVITNAIWPLFSRNLILSQYLVHDTINIRNVEFFRKLGPIFRSILSAICTIEQSNDSNSNDSNSNDSNSNDSNSNDSNSNDSNSNDSKEPCTVLDWALKRLAGGYFFETPELYLLKLMFRVLNKTSSPEAYSEYINEWTHRNLKPDRQAKLRQLLYQIFKPSSRAYDDSKSNNKRRRLIMKEEDDEEEDDDREDDDREDEKALQAWYNNSNTQHAIQLLFVETL